MTTTTTPLTLTTIARSRVPDHRRLRLLPALALLWHQPLEVRLHGRWERGHWTPQVTRDQGLGARRRQVLPREARQHRIPRLDRSQIVLLTLSSLIVAGLTSNHTPRILHQSCTKKNIPPPVCVLPLPFILTINQCKGWLQWNSHRKESNYWTPKKQKCFNFKLSY